MNLLEGMKAKSLVFNTKGSKYYLESFNSNLDVFSMLSRNMSDEMVIGLFNNALRENSSLALANLLYILDIRGGKGERRLFKIIFKYLCEKYPKYALKILPFISELGRYDYILVGMGTKIEDDVIALIDKQLKEDIKSSHPSLLAKWLPSHRSHNQNSSLAKIIMKKLHKTEKEYRLMLSDLRRKLNILEKNLTSKDYDNIEFNEVSSKAMIKYTNCFKEKMPLKYEEYKDGVRKGKNNINTDGLFAYEIIKKVLNNACDEEVLDLMWNHQKDILKGCKSNILVMADTSGSMFSYNEIPFASAIGLAIYTAERNEGIFKNHFLTFSEEPYLCEVKGESIKDKVNNIPIYVANTDIDKAFKLILDVAKENKLKQSELPSHLLIISDMEFDAGIYSEDGTNFDGWKKAFSDEGYVLPKIIFWNVAGNIGGIPVTKFDKDVAMISGFSINILDNLLNLENYTPIDIMMNQLTKYLDLLETGAITK